MGRVQLCVLYLHCFHGLPHVELAELKQSLRFLRPCFGDVLTGNYTEPLSLAANDVPLVLYHACPLLNRKLSNRDASFGKDDSKSPARYGVVCHFCTEAGGGIGPERSVFGVSRLLPRRHSAAHRHSKRSPPHPPTRIAPLLRCIHSSTVYVLDYLQ